MADTLVVGSLVVAGTPVALLKSAVGTDCMAVRGDCKQDGGPVCGPTD